MNNSPEENSKNILKVMLGFSLTYIVFAILACIVQVRSDQPLAALMTMLSKGQYEGITFAQNVASNFKNLIPGFVSIMTIPAQFTRDYFEELGGLGSAFLNCGMVGLGCWGVCKFSGAKATGATIAAYFLNVGFATFGMNFLNMWPYVLGVFIYSRLKKVKFGSVANLALFSTALAPFASELLFRHPFQLNTSSPLVGVALALAVGIFTGIFMPSVCKHSPNFHKGYDLYNAGPAAGFIAFFVLCMLYKIPNIELPTNTNLGNGYRAFVTLFCFVLFGGCLVIGWLKNGKSLKGYRELLKDSGHGVDFVSKYGFPVAMINLGFYGLFIWAYFFFVTLLPNVIPALTPAHMNGATMGAIFCMFAFCAAGAHPKNVYPIIIGYAIMSIYATAFGNWTLTTQGILVGLCFASGLAPVSGKYGAWAGIIAGMFHAALVLSVPMFHGGFCLYNGGFTCGIVAFILIPVLECFAKTKEEKAAAKAN